MKRLLITLLSVILLTGCTSLDEFSTQPTIRIADHKLVLQLQNADYEYWPFNPFWGNYDPKLYVRIPASLTDPPPDASQDVRLELDCQAKIASFYIFKIGGPSVYKKAEFSRTSNEKLLIKLCEQAGEQVDRRLRGL